MSTALATKQVTCNYRFTGLDNDLEFFGTCVIRYEVDTGSVLSVHALTPSELVAMVNRKCGKTL